MMEDLKRDLNLEEEFKLNYIKNGIGFEVDGKSNNFIEFKDCKNGFKLHFPSSILIDESSDIEQGNVSWSKYIILYPDTLKKHEKTIKQIIKNSLELAFKAKE